MILPRFPKIFVGLCQVYPVVDCEPRDTQDAQGDREHHHRQAQRQRALGLRGRGGQRPVPDGKGRQGQTLQPGRKCRPQGRGLHAYHQWARSL